MCTLVALHRCTPGAFLWIAANRDEYVDRPSDGPALREGRSGAVVAPLDRRAGGTWWGVNAQRRKPPKPPMLSWPPTVVRALAPSRWMALKVN
jgi:hypothetical protein